MKKQLLLLLSVALTACAAAPQVPPVKLPEPVAVTLNTQDVRVINRAYAIPQSAPYIGHLFTPTVIDAVDNWAKNGVRAAGSDGHATIVVKDASLTERPLVMDEGMTRWMWRQQSKKYIARVEVEITAQSPRGDTGVATAHAVHAVTLPEDPTEEEKSVAYQKLLTALMRALDASARQAMQEHMSHFIVKTETPAAMPLAASPSAAVKPALTDNSGPVVITGGNAPVAATK